MKNLIKIATVALGVGFTGITNAQSIESPLAVETPTFLASFRVMPESSRLRVNVGRREGNETTLFVGLKDTEGHEIYSRKLGKNEKQAVVLLNLANLEDGIYTFEMSDKNGSVTKIFRKGTEQLVVKPTATLVAINDKPIKN
jgi:hypothetical protein